MHRTIVSLLVLLAAMSPARADDFKLLEGDRVVLIGGTLIEREQKYGYWETALTLAHPDKNITFRNLGWSGDTVWGESRASFDPPAIGYKRLIDHTLALKPTVIIIGYGSNESFAGEEGLPRFRKQLDKLLDDLSPSKARVVLLAPPLVDAERWPNGKPDERNAAIKLYTEANKKAAEGRQAFFADEFCQRYGPGDPLTDAGMHLTAFGYWSTACNLLNELRLGKQRQLDIIELHALTPVRYQQKVLPNPPVPSEPGTRAVQGDSLLRVKGLRPGKYMLKIDGRQVTIMPTITAKPVSSAEAVDWLKMSDLGGLVVQGPSLDQAEQLRKLIVEKNQLYFHRWRPQNETYLFGFRKKEQGRNAKEIPEFDPLIEKLEKEIAKVKVPVEHRYELVETHRPEE